MVGDLKNSRVLHSQCHILKHFAVNFVFVGPKALAMPDYIKDELKKHGRTYTEKEDLSSSVSDMDVLSHTRIQEERFSSPEEANKFRGIYIVDNKIMGLCKEKMIVLSPLPRVDELPVEVDSDPRAKYFEQIQNGVVVRI